MPKFEVIASIEEKNVRSLIWNRDQLVDWIGGVRFDLEGKVQSAPSDYSLHFDAACCSPDHQYTVVYQRLGTKGLLLRGSQVLRELNRSDYQASAYEYPICFATLGTGQVVLIHCPNEYNEIEIDDAATGERLTQGSPRSSMDFFHSRFSVTQDGRYLVSAGWVWHPFSTVCIFDLEKAISDPSSLDTDNLFPAQSTETASAVFQNSKRLILCTSSETFSAGEFEDHELRPNSVCVWDIEEGRIESLVEVQETVGSLMPVGDEHVVGFFEHPKLISLKSGEVLTQLTGLNSGKQNSSIIYGLDAIPPIAIDPQRNRFAVASADQVVVVEVKV